MEDGVIDQSARDTDADIVLKNPEDAFAKRLDLLWGAAQAETSALSLGQNVAQYELQGILGAGAFGIVYRALDTVLNRTVALKLPRLEVLFDKEKCQRFATEATLAASLQHPGIVPVYEAVLDGPTPFIASAFCDGSDMAKWLTQQNEPVGWQKTALLMAEIADAVDYAHQQGVHHRDLKPANILLVPRTDADSSTQRNSSGISNFRFELEFSPLLTDFGLAKLLDPMLVDTRSSTMLGTPLYMAPEQLERGDDSQLTAATDIYSLGVILFELLCHEVPIEGTSYVEVLDNIRTQRPKRLRKLRPEAPRDLERICSKCLEKDPNSRYARAADLANDLRRCVDGQPILGKSPSLLTRLGYWCTRPARIANAGWYAIVSHLVVIVWVVAGVMLVPFKFELSTMQWAAQLNEVVWLTCFSVAPVLLLGWLVVQRRRWAIYLLFLVTLGKIPFQIRAMIYEPIYLNDLYERGDIYAFMDHFLLAVCLMFQLFLLCCAAAADRKHHVCH